MDNSIGRLGSTDTVVLIIYLLATLALGCYFIRKNKNPDQFMKAGGKLPAWAVGLSIFGTYVSSISFLGNPGLAFSSNWSGWVFNLSVPLATVIAVKYFIPYYRKANVVSCYEPLEERFGLWARIYTSICFLLTQVARMGVILYLLALPINQLTGWGIVPIIIVTGIMVMVYTCLGGIEGVIYTDALQAVVLIIGALVSAFLIIYKMPGGAPKLISYAMEHNKFSLGSFSILNSVQTTFWIILAFGFTNNLQNLGIDQNYVQRYITAKSESAAKKSAWISAIMYIPVSAVFFFIGTALYVYYKTQPHLLNPNLLQQMADGKGDNFFPYFIVHNLPYGMAGIVVAAIFAAAMSTLSSSLNATATLINEDYYKRFFKGFNEKKSMLLLRITTFVFGFIAVGAAITMINVKSALDLNWILAGIFGGGILGLFLLSMISHKIRHSAALIGTIVGILVIAYLALNNLKNFFPTWVPSVTLNGLLTPVIGTALIILVGFILTVIINNLSKNNR